MSKMIYLVILMESKEPVMAFLKESAAIACVAEADKTDCLPREVIEVELIEENS